MRLTVRHALFLRRESLSSQWHVTDDRPRDFQTSAVVQPAGTFFGNSISACFDVWNLSSIFLASVWRHIIIKSIIIIIIIYIYKAPFFITWSKAPSVYSRCDVHITVYLTSYSWKQSRLLCYACCLQRALLTVLRVQLRYETKAS